MTASQLDEYISDYPSSVVEKLQELRSEGCWHSQTTSKSIYTGLGGTVVPPNTWDELSLSDLSFRISHRRGSVNYEQNSDCVPVISRGTLIHNPTTALAFISLARSLARLPFSHEEIVARQEAMQELAENPALTERLEGCLGDAAAEGMYTAMVGPGGSLTDQYIPSLVAVWYSDVRNAFTRFRNDLDTIPMPTSPLLRRVVEHLHAFARSETASLFADGMRVSAMGLSTIDDPVTPKLSIRYRPLLLNPILSLPYYAPALLVAAGIPMSLWGGPESAAMGGTLLKAALGTGVAAIAYSLAGGGSAKKLVRDALITKARRDVPTALGALALAHEMLALNAFTKDTSHPCGFLKPIPSNDAAFCATDMGSPLHAHAQTFVYNCAEIDDSDPTLIMGPNSAGKTTWMRSVMTNWLMAMLGSRCFARSGYFSPASRIIMSVPKQSTTTAIQGRFGEELSWLRPELLRGLDSSCVIGFDEIGSGTAEPAAANIGIPIIDTLREHGCRIVIASHNGSLKDALSASHIPTHALHPEVLLVTKPDGSVEADSSHRVLPGYPDAAIPPESGAWRVLSEMGLSREDLREFREKARARRGLGSPASSDGAPNLPPSS